MARFVFLGRLEDIAGGGEREVPAGRLADLLATLRPELAAALSDERIRLALNGTLVSRETDIVIGADDELAFLPPVSGG